MADTNDIEMSLMSQKVTYIAMWSPPRCLSTVLMRAWENRLDTVVWDEPLLAPYTFHTKEKTVVPHNELFAHHETNWVKVVKQLTAPLPKGKTISYQKHQPDTLIEEIIGLEWINKQFTNCFLIRNPQEMLPSFLKSFPLRTLKQTSWPQLKRIFEYVHSKTGVIPHVIDTRDLQDNPRHTLSLLCEALGVEFTETMLSWPAGKRPSDGIWAKYWYGTVEKSTHFQPYQPKPKSVPDNFLGLLEQCDEIYQQLYKYRLH
jgi:hypothetical protein